MGHPNIYFNGVKKWQKNKKQKIKMILRMSPLKMISDLDENKSAEEFRFINRRNG